MKIKPRQVGTVALLIGVALVFYGLFFTVVTNEEEIRDIHNCDRTTQEDVRASDRYCEDPKSAPEATTTFNWPFVILGALLVAGGGFLLGEWSGDETMRKADPKAKNIIEEQQEQPKKDE